MQGQDREYAQRDRPSVRPASIEDADGRARRGNTWNEDRRRWPFGSRGNEHRQRGAVFLNQATFAPRIPARRDRRCRRSRCLCRGCCRKIANGSADVLVVPMQPRRTRCRRSTSEATSSTICHERNRERESARELRHEADLLFEREVRPTKSPTQRARQAWWNARPVWRETAHRTIGEGTTPTPRTHGA